MSFSDISLRAMCAAALLASGWATAADANGQGSRAEARRPHLTCTEARAEWRGEELDGQIAGPRPGPNRWVGIDVCRGAGRLMVIKAEAFYPPHWRCSAHEYANVSVWIDGRKVLDAEPASSYLGCETRLDASDSEGWVTSVSVARTGDVTVCRRRDYLEEGQPPPTCSTDKLTRFEVDSSYVPPGRVTAPTLELRVTNAPFCSSLTKALSLVPDVRGPDRSLSRFALPAAAGWAAATEDATQEGETKLDARFDADNDGKPDEVALTWTGSDPPTDIAWRPAGSPHPAAHRAGYLPWGIDQPGLPTLKAGDTNGNRFNIRPVRIGGRTYIYQRRLGRFFIASDEEALAGARRDGGGTITRGLVELHPDGRTTLACGWGPRLRPEEFL